MMLNVLMLIIAGIFLNQPGNPGSTSSLESLNKSRQGMMAIDLSALQDEQKEIFERSMTLLQRYPDFEEGNHILSLPEWTYSAKSDPRLLELSEKYHLKELTGNRTGFEEALDLMNWTHRMLHKPAGVGNPERPMTPEIIDYVKNTEYTVNCRMYAIVLNEVLLSQGFQSRRISFRPARFDGDSHALVMVFLREKQKWICLDPMFNTYFHDGKGEPLGPIEIRESYKRGEIPPFRSIQLKIQSSLRLNGIPFTSYDSWYALYIAKNCFSFVCPLVSEFGYEFSDVATWIWLLPSSYQPQQMGFSLPGETDEAPKMILMRDKSHFLQDPLPLH